MPKPSAWIIHGASAFNVNTHKFPFKCMHGDPFTHGAATVRVSHHNSEKAHEGLGTSYEDIIIYKPG